jgi:hypothetical protein
MTSNEQTIILTTGLAKELVARHVKCPVNSIKLSKSIITDAVEAVYKLHVTSIVYTTGALFNLDMPELLSDVFIIKAIKP